MLPKATIQHVSGNIARLVDQPIAALLKDLKARGLLEGTWGNAWSLALARRGIIKPSVVHGRSAASDREIPIVRQSRVPTSDLDFLVDFQPMEAGAPGAHAKSYFGLWFGLQELFHRSVDVVEIPAITNPYFLKNISGQRQVLYAA